MKGIQSCTELSGSLTPSQPVLEQTPVSGGDIFVGTSKPPPSVLALRQPECAVSNEARAARIKSGPGLAIQIMTVRNFQSTTKLQEAAVRFSSQNLPEHHLEASLLSHSDQRAIGRPFIINPPCTSVPGPENLQRQLLYLRLLIEANLL